MSGNKKYDKSQKEIDGMMQSLTRNIFYLETGLQKSYLHTLRQILLVMLLAFGLTKETEQAKDEEITPWMIELYELIHGQWKQISSEYEEEDS